MTRRADPIRIYLAQRAGFERKLVEALGYTPERAAASIAAWEGEAARRGLRTLDDGYWAQAEAWLADGGRSKPKD